MKKVLACFLIILAAATLYVRNLYRSQDSQILRNTPLAQNYEYVWDTPFEEVFIETPSKEKINGLLFFSKTPAKGVILYLHGRGYNLGEFWGFRVQDYARYGYDVLSIDYRGFGKSTGTVSEATLLEDSDLAYTFLTERYDEKEIIVYGQSLGTAFGTYVASRHEPQMLILEAPYYNMIEAAKATKPYLPTVLIDSLLKYRLRADLWIQEVTCPIHIFHGTKDHIVPYSSGQKLYSLVQDHAEFITLEGWGHDGTMYNKEYIDHLNKILGTSRTMHTSP